MVEIEHRRATDVPSVHVAEEASRLVPRFVVASANRHTDAVREALAREHGVQERDGATSVRDHVAVFGRFESEDHSPERFCGTNGPGAERLGGHRHELVAVLLQADDEVPAALLRRPSREVAILARPPRLLVVELRDDAGGGCGHCTHVARDVQPDLRHRFERVALAAADLLCPTLNGADDEHHAVHVVALVAILRILELLEEAGDLVGQRALGANERFQLRDVLTVLANAHFALQVAADRAIEHLVREPDEPMERLEIREDPSRCVRHAPMGAEDTVVESRNHEIDIFQADGARLDEAREAEEALPTGVALDDVTALTHPEGTFADGDGVFLDHLALDAFVGLVVAVPVHVDEEGGETNLEKAENGIATALGGTDHGFFPGFAVACAVAPVQDNSLASSLTSTGYFAILCAFFSELPRSMPLPSFRSSRSKVRRRRSHHALKPQQVAVCAKCEAILLQHRACKNCGAYGDRNVAKKGAAEVKKVIAKTVKKAPAKKAAAKKTSSQPGHEGHDHA